METQQLDREQVRASEQLNRREHMLPPSVQLRTHVQQLAQEDLRRAPTARIDRSLDAMDVDRSDLVDIEQSARFLNYDRAIRSGKSHITIGGKEKRVTEKDYTKLRMAVERRAIARADVIITTLDNASRLNMEEWGFKPTLIIFEEAGQTTLPAFMLALTLFTTWEAAIPFGDWKQLLPPIAAKKITEALDSSLVSPLEVLAKHKDYVITLNEQMRMCPEISYFPRTYVYDGELLDALSVLPDNANRMAMRSITEVLLPGKSSELLWIDVPMSCARREDGGTSMLNYGNATAIDNVIKMLIDRGVAPSSIVILPLYQAQKRLLIKKIKRNADGSLRYHEISTADGYQGRQSDIIIVDYVVGERLNLWGPSSDDASSDAKIQVAYPHLTAFAKDFHRLNVSLTRARDGLIVVGQHALFLSLDKKGSRLSNTMQSMAEDAQTRGLVYHAWDIVDDHPEAIQDRAKYEAQHKNRYDKSEVQKRHFAYIARRLAKLRSKDR
ncbi:MAG: hypothetical protein Q9224_006206 [Gallowayella concinna]